MMYTMDVWLMPPRWWEGAKRCIGSVGMVNKMVSLQRVVALAITGTMCTMVTDILNLHTDLMLMWLMIHRLCQQATL